jgi:hypothetical protein
VVHDRVLDNPVVRIADVGLEDRGQGELGCEHRRLTEPTVLVDRGQLDLELVGKQLVAVLPQEDEELGATDTPDDGLLRRRELNGWMPD